MLLLTCRQEGGNSTTSASLSGFYDHTKYWWWIPRGRFVGIRQRLSIVRIVGSTLAVGGDVIGVCDRFRRCSWSRVRGRICQETVRFRHYPPLPAYPFPYLLIPSCWSPPLVTWMHLSMRPCPTAHPFEYVRPSSYQYMWSSAEVLSRWIRKLMIEGIQCFRAPVKRGWESLAQKMPLGNATIYWSRQQSILQTNVNPTRRTRGEIRKDEAERTEGCCRSKCMSCRWSGDIRPDQAWKSLVQPQCKQATSWNPF